MCQALTQSDRRPEIPPFSGEGLTGRFLPRQTDDFPVVVNPENLAFDSFRVMTTVTPRK